MHGFFQKIAKIYEIFKGKLAGQVLKRLPYGLHYPEFLHVNTKYEKPRNLNMPKHVFEKTFEKSMENISV